MEQINKPVLISPIGPFPVNHLLTVYYDLLCLLSVIRIMTETQLISISLSKDTSLHCGSLSSSIITKTRLFKYTENFTTKK